MDHGQHRLLCGVGHDPLARLQISSSNESYVTALKESLPQGKGRALEVLPANGDPERDESSAVFT